MIIKAARLHGKHGRPQGRARVGRRYPPPKKKIKKKFFDYIGGLFVTFSSYGGLFATFFLFLGAFLLLFTSWWGPFFGLAPPPRKFLRAPMIARRVQEHDCNLVSSGHVGKCRNFKCILIRFFSQKILEIFTYCTKKCYCSQAIARESWKRISGAI